MSPVRRHLLRDHDDHHHDYEQHRGREGGLETTRSTHVHTPVRTEMEREREREREMERERELGLPETEMADLRNDGYPRPNPNHDHDHDPGVETDAPFSAGDTTSSTLTRNPSSFAFTRDPGTPDHRTMLTTTPDAGTGTVPPTRRTPPGTRDVGTGTDKFTPRHHPHPVIIHTP